MRRIIPELADRRAYTNAVMHLMDPRSATFLLTGSNDEVWSEQTIAVRLQKRYPNIDLADFSYELICLPNRVIVWLYPKAYLQMCQELCTDHFLLTLAAPVCFMSTPLSRVEIPLDEGEWMYLKYDHNGYFQEARFTALPSENDETVSQCTSPSDYLNRHDAFLSSSERQYEVTAVFKRGLLGGRLLRTAAVLAVLALLVIASNAVAFRGNQARLQQSRSIERLTREVGEKEKQNGNLREELYALQAKQGWKLAGKLNRILQSRSDLLYFEEADIRLNDGGIILSVSGVAETEGDISAFMTAISNEEVTVAEFKQNRDGRKLRFEADLNWK